MVEEAPPFIESPDMTAPKGTELYCFIDSARPCTAECMAFLPVRPEGPDYEGQQFAACSLLVNLHKLGKHHVAIAQQGAALLKHHRVKAQDDARTSQPLPPKAV